MFISSVICGHFCGDISLIRSLVELLCHREKMKHYLLKKKNEQRAINLPFLIGRKRNTAKIDIQVLNVIKVLKWLSCVVRTNVKNGIYTRNLQNVDTKYLMAIFKGDFFLWCFKYWGGGKWDKPQFMSNSKL